MMIKSRFQILLAIATVAAIATGCGKQEGAQGTPADTAAATVRDDAGQPPRMHDSGGATVTAGEVKTYTFHGTPLKIDAAEGMITIKHEKIEGYMDAMTMPYKVASADILKQVTVGKETHFTLRVAGDQALIVKAQEEHEKGEKHDTAR